MSDLPSTGVLEIVRSTTDFPKARSWLGLALSALALALLTGWLLQLTAFEAVLTSAQIFVCTLGFVGGWYPSVRPTQAISFGFLLPYLGLAPIYQLAKGAAAWSDEALMNRSNDPMSDYALILNLVASVVLLLGFTYTRHRKFSRSTYRIARVRPLSAWVYLGAAGILTPAAVSAAGGLSGMFSDRAARDAALTNAGITLDRAGGAEVALVSLLPADLSIASAYLFFMLVVPAVRSKGFAAIKGTHALGLALALTLVVLLANPFVNGRFLFILTLGSMVLYVLHPSSAAAGRRLGLIVVLGTVVVYPLANVFRTKNFALATGFKAFASPDFDGFQQVINGIAFARDRGFTWGHYTLSAIFYFIPRSIWHSKAFPAAEQVAAYRGYTFTNLSLPINAEFYIDFGPVGMALLLLLAGILLGRLDNSWLRQPSSRLSAMTAPISLSTLGIIRGPLGANGPIFLTLLGLLFLGMSRERTAEPTVSGGQRSKSSADAASESAFVGAGDVVSTVSITRAATR